MPNDNLPLVFTRKEFYTHVARCSRTHYEKLVRDGLGPVETIVGVGSQRKHVVITRENADAWLRLMTQRAIKSA
jgi:hypothetical protein